MTTEPLMPPDAQVVEFLREAHERGWPEGVSKVDVGGHPGFEQTTFSLGDYSFVDLYRGATTDVGMEMIFWQRRQIWGAVYRGGVTSSVDESDAIFDFLIKALGARSPDALPIRGPKRFAEHGRPLVYRHELVGSIGSFSSLEQIHDHGAVVYERITVGGWSGDNALYGPPQQQPAISPEAHP